MKRNVTYLKLFILINISNLYSFKFNKTTTKIFFNDILNFCKKNKKLTCSLSIPIVLSIGYLIYKKIENYKLNKIENYELFKIFKKKLDESKDQNIDKQEQTQDNSSQSQKEKEIKKIYKNNIINFIDNLNNYSILKNKLKNATTKLEADQSLNSFNLANTVSTTLNRNLEDKSQIINNNNNIIIINNFVKDFEKANHKFQNKIISHIKKMFSLDDQKKMFSLDDKKEW